MKRNILIRTTLFVFLLTLTLLVACNSDTMKNQNVKSSVAETLQKQTKIDSFNIVISSAGGITGLGSGYTLASNGKVKHWRQLSFVKDTTLWERESDLSKILNFKNELDTCGILQKQYRETSNMTTSLNYNIQDTSYTWTWKGKGEEENIPAEINNWYKDVIKFCTEINK